MSAIFKYPLPVADRSVVVLPRGAEIVHIDAQGFELFVWAVVDPDVPPTVEHEYRIAGTGHPFDGEGLEHRVTVQMVNGLVWHVFEEV